MSEDNYEWVSLDRELKEEYNTIDRYVKDKTPFDYIDDLIITYDIQTPKNKCVDTALDLYTFYKKKGLNNLTTLTLRTLGRIAIEEYYKTVYQAEE